MKRISDKRAAQLADYKELRWRILPNPYQWGYSELSGELGFLIFHHIDGRRGARLLMPFNIIAITELEHREIHAHNTPELKEKLAGIVKEIRLKQGFKESLKW